MTAPHAAGWSRREVLGRLTLAGTAGFLSVHPRPSPAEPPLEATTLRVIQAPLACVRPRNSWPKHSSGARGFAISRT